MKRGSGGCVQIFRFILSAVCFILLFIPLLAEAIEPDLEKELQQSLIQSSKLVQQALQKQKNAAAIDDEITRLKDISESIKINHALLQERFRLRQEAVNQLGGKAEQRQSVMEAGYLKALEEYLILSEQLSAISDQLQTIETQNTLQKLKTLLDRILPKSRRPIFGSLPYRNLNYPAREPDTSPAMKPAYKGGNKVVSPDDTKSTEEAPISKEIAEFAQSLNWKPVAIYEFVKNEISTEWYWGCQKGAEETLRQKSGSDCDQAALFASLLRASGFPTRYVRGTIEFFAGGRDGIPMEKIKNLTGIDDPLKIAEFFQKAGIPYKPVIQGGKITNFQIEHIWVESRIPYGNYRGTMIDNSDPTWLGLDTSIKPKGFTYNNPRDIMAVVSLAGLKDIYLKTDSNTMEPLEYIKTVLEAYLARAYPSVTYNDLLRTRTLIPESMKILPDTMQFDQKKITHEYTEIPEELKHKVKLSAFSNQPSANSNQLFEITLPTYKLSNRQIALTYEPETVEDQQIIDSYGGLDNTPAYLVKLRPVLKVDGERMVVGRDGLPMGADYNLTIEIISPNGIERVTNTHITGNLAAIGIVAGKTLSAPSPLVGEGGGEGDKDAEQLLHDAAINYIDRWNRAEDELASLLHVVITRPIPTVVTVGGVIDVTYLLDMPHGFEWKGVFVDASKRTIEVTTSRSPLTQGGDQERKKTFMQFSGLQGSILENRIFEDDFQVESISTAKLIQIVGANGGSPILTIDKTNIAAVLSASDLADNIKEDITNAVNQGLIVRIPSADGLPLSAINYNDWTGIGYVKENLSTGEAGYMLSGMIAGGVSVITPANWSNKELKDILSHPNSKESNPDPMSAFKIAKFSATDRQRAIVGKKLIHDLEVIVVDKNNRLVKGAIVIFTAVAGNGNFGKDRLGQVKTIHETTTSINGTAKAPFNVGTETVKNPGYMKLTSTDQYVTQIGKNIVTVTVKSAIGNLSLSPPFESYGMPDLPFEIKKVLGDGTVGLANNPTGSLVVKVVDKYGNPISNRRMKMKANSILPRYTGTTLPPNPRGIEFYDEGSCNNVFPLYGDCPSKAEVPLTTEYYGAISSAFFGDTVATKYSVEVSDITSITTNLLPTYFELFTTGFRASDNYIPPGIYLRYLQPVNDSGQPINASRAGTLLKAPLIAEFILMRDDVRLEGPASCSSGEGSCWRLTSTGKVITEKITNGTVAFAAAAGGGTAGQTVNLNNGKYRTTYTTGPQPMVNLVEAGGTATITVPKVLYNPMVTGTVVPSFGADYPGTPRPLAITEYSEGSLQCTNGNCTLPMSNVTLKGGQQAIFYATEPPLAAGNELKAKYTVYGVDVLLTIEPKYLIVDEQNYTRRDATLKYNILPAEYNAATADIDLYRLDQNAQEEWINYLAVDKTQGEGSGIYAAGSQFDPALKHMAQVVLNRGSDVEIRGVKVPLPLGQFKIVTDDEDRLPLNGAVTDGAARIRLQLIAKHNKEAFANLMWKVYDSQLKVDPTANGNTLRGTLLDGNNNPTEALYVTFNSDGIAEAVYRAPETFVRWGTSQESNDKEIPERNIQPTLDIAYSLLTGVEMLPQIRIKRPPVVLVHGIWGNAKAWKVFEPKLNDKSLYDIVKVDYSERGQVSSIVNHASELQSSIYDAIGIAKKHLLAANKVDIIAHSMGGLLTREYCEQNPAECKNSDQSKNKIRRFVTIDTPHFGSELADLLLVYREDIDKFPLQPLCRKNVERFISGGKIQLSKYLSFLQFPQKEAHPIGPRKSEDPNGSAIDDLATGRLPNFINSTTNTGRWLGYKENSPLADTFSAHAIVGIVPAGVDGYDMEIWGLWQFVLRDCGFTPENVFGAASDRIVPILSQQGGLADGNATLINETDHFSVRNWPDTINRIKLLLDTSNSALFSR